jgi:chemotaxis protein CheY-P-specific phosphatase CheC
MVNIGNFVKNSTMDLQSRKIEFIQEFLKIQRGDTVIRLEKLLEKEKARIESEDLKLLSNEELHKRIDRSISDSKQNRLTENADLLREVQKWH